jgi:ribosome production factor 2
VYLGVVSMRSYKVNMKKSGLTIPRIELESIGPDMDLTFRRCKLAPIATYGKACKLPQGVVTKKVKNIHKVNESLNF